MFIQSVFEGNLTEEMNGVYWNLFLKYIRLNWTEIKVKGFKINTLTVVLMQLRPKILITMARKHQLIDDRNLRTMHRKRKRKKNKTLNLNWEPHVSDMLGSILCRRWPSFISQPTINIAQHRPQFNGRMPYHCSCYLPNLLCILHRRCISKVGADFDFGCRMRIS